MTEAKQCVNLGCRYYGERVCRCYPDTVNHIFGMVAPVGRPPITHEAAPPSRAEFVGPNLDANPALPKLLRALASGRDAQVNGTHIILTAAADELEFWRINYEAGTWKESS